MKIVKSRLKQIINEEVKRFEEEQNLQEYDDSAANELELYITNDAQLYKQQYLPIIKNLMTKKARGQYDSEKATKLFMYLVQNGAKKYTKEHGSGDYKQIFDRETRVKVAQELRDAFEAEASTGNYDEMLPKKYQVGEEKVEEAKGWQKFSDVIEKNLLAMNDLIEIDNVSNFQPKERVLIKQALNHLQQANVVLEKLTKIQGYGAPIKEEMLPDEKKANEMGRKYAEKTPLGSVKDSEQMYQAAIKMGVNPALFDIFKYAAQDVWRIKGELKKDDIKETHIPKGVYVMIHAPNDPQLSKYSGKSALVVAQDKNDTYKVRIGGDVTGKGDGQEMVVSGDKLKLEEELTRKESWVFMNTLQNLIQDCEEALYNLQNSKEEVSSDLLGTLNTNARVVAKLAAKSREQKMPLEEQTDEPAGRKEFDKGFNDGNYASSYETEEYKRPRGQSKYYRIGHLLGFFSSYEDHEVPQEWQEEVSKWRKKFKNWL